MSWKDKLKKPGYISAFALAGAGVAIPLFFLFKGCGSDGKREEITSVKDPAVVFEGRVNERNVVYKENSEIGIYDTKEKKSVNKKANIMNVSNGNRTYSLIDYAKFGGIDWESNNAPDYSADSLEKVIISEKGRRGEADITVSFDVEDVDDSTISGQTAGRMLEKGTKYFNNLRTEIRKKKRIDYSEKTKTYEDFFDSGIPVYRPLPPPAN